VVRATCSIYLTFLDVIVITRGEGYKLDACVMLFGASYGAMASDLML
jgi:hypothetical protein